MDGTDIQSDLRALKSLYGLLKKDGGEASDTSSDSLDAHARLLLKNLLDLETKRVLKTHSEVIAGQAEASGSLSPARLQQPDEAASEERPTPHSRLSLAVEGYQSSDGRLTPDWSQAGAVEQSIHRVPSIGQKRCRICRRNTFKRLGSTGETHFSDVARNSNTYVDHYLQQQNNVQNRETISKPEEPDCLSQEASKAIQKIELYMSALPTEPDQLHLFEKTSSAQPQNHVPETESFLQTKYDAVPSGGTSLGQTVMDDFFYPMHQLPRMKAEEGNQASKAVLKQSTTNIIQSKPVSNSDVLDMSEELADKYRSNKVNKIYVQNMNAIVEKIEPVNWIMSSNGFALIPNETSYIAHHWPATFASNMKNPYQSRLLMEDEESKPLFSFTNQKDHPPKVIINKKATDPSAPSGFHGNQSDARDKVGVRKDRPYTAAVKTSLQNQESDGTATDSYSDWSSQQQTSSRASNSEDYSVTEGSRDLRYVSSSKSSGSWDFTPSHGSGSRYRSLSEEEVYSSSSGEGARANSSSGNEEYSSYEEPIRSHARPKDFTSKKSGPNMIGKAYKKQSGIWKKLKNKLAVVFHHHHHHYHHHHHHNRGGDRTNDETNMSRNSSLNKHKGKAINPKGQDEEHDANGVAKIGKKQIHERRRQQNNFPGLVGSLMRHVRHSKKSKGGKGKSDKLAKGHGLKRSVNKSHWWQLLQHHHHRSKKANLKLGFGKKKGRLKALPNIE